MDKKSIIIVGKGPSVNKCNKDYVNSFDEVAICGRPIFKNYEHLIGERADYDFLNCGDPRIYSKDLIKKLGIKKIFNIGERKIERKINIIPFTDIDYESDLRCKLLPYFKKEYNLDPSCGIFAFKYLLDTKKYNKISLVGFDLLEVGENIYYFKKEEVQDSLKYYFYDNRKDDGWVYNKEGIRMKKSGHDSKISKKYIEDMIKNNKEISFEILSNRDFKLFDNLRINRI